MAPQKHCGVNAFSRTCIILCILSLAPCNPLSPNPDAIKTNEIPRRNTADETPSDEICAACHSRFLHKGQRKASKLDVKLEEIRRIAIEKKKILDRLGLPARPNITDKDRQYPEKITEEMKTIPQPDIPSEHENSAPRANTRGLYLFAEPPSTGRSRRSVGIAHACPWSAGGSGASDDVSAACFTVSSGSDITQFEVESAILWLYRKPVKKGKPAKKLTFRLSELNFQAKDEAPRETFFKTFEIAKSTKWTKLDILDLFREWQKAPSSSLKRNLRIECNSCKSGARFPIAFQPAYRPFIEVSVKRTIERKRRDGAACEPDFARCCFRVLYINFTQIGWDDWILQPPGYYTGFCVGHCRYGSETPYSVIQSKAAQAAEENSVYPCCRPRNVTSIDLIYTPGKEVLRAAIDLIVQSCMC